MDVAYMRAVTASIASGNVERHWALVRHTNYEQDAKHAISLRGILPDSLPIILHTHRCIYIYIDVYRCRYIGQEVKCQAISPGVEVRGSSPLE